MGNCCKKRKNPNNIQNEEEEIQKLKENKIIKEIKSKKSIKINLINKIKHSNRNDTIEDVIKIPKFENTIIIGCRSGDIKEISKILSENNSNIIILYSCLKRLYSLILLKKNNKLCIGLENQIIILRFNIDDKHKLDKELELTLEEEGPIYSLLELKNENIISAGKNIILWEKNSFSKYNQIKSISIGNSRIVNLVEFPIFNTILATQENTNKIYLFKNYRESIDLIKITENVTSLWYKGSAQNCSKNSMILVGKFELNIIDGKNGDVVTKYPGINRGNLLKINLKGKKNNFWLISNFIGESFEIYEQEGNDFFYYDNFELNCCESFGWGHKLVKINDECLAATNHYGNIFIYKISQNV